MLDIFLLFAEMCCELFSGHVICCVHTSKGFRDNYHSTLVSATSHFTYSKTHSSIVVTCETNLKIKNKFTLIFFI